MKVFFSKNFKIHLIDILVILINRLYLVSQNKIIFNSKKKLNFIYEKFILSRFLKIKLFIGKNLN